MILKLHRLETREQNDEVILYYKAYGCPKKERRVECQLSEIDHLSFQDKITRINQLKDERIEAIIKHHQLCSRS